MPDYDEGPYQVPEPLEQIEDSRKSGRSLAALHGISAVLILIPTISIFMSWDRVSQNVSWPYGGYLVLTWPALLRVYLMFSKGKIPGFEQQMVSLLVSCILVPLLLFASMLVFMVVCLAAVNGIKRFSLPDSAMYLVLGLSGLAALICFGWLFALSLRLSA